jgi:hypothetical protein
MEGPPRRVQYRTRLGQDRDFQPLGFRPGLVLAVGPDLRVLRREGRESRS